MDADRIVEVYLRSKQSPALREPLVSDGTTPRGIRNNNPGNIRAATEAWQGQAGADAGGMCIFESAFYGIRALSRLLLTYQTHYGLSTVSAIIGRWAPPNENDTGAYVDAVCRDTSFTADAWLHLSEADTLAAMVRAIIHHENGQQPYDDAEISGGVQAALSA